ncbi:MAG: hypothetical protein ACI4SG_00610 [Oligosphaeraceae bacterium]
MTSPSPRYPVVRFLPALLLGLSLLLPGFCQPLAALSLELTLSFRKDGSLETKWEVQVPEKAAGILQQMLALEGAAPGLFPPEEEVWREMVGQCPGVTLEECRSYGQTEGRRYVLRLRAEDGEALLSSGMLGQVALEKPQGEKGVRVLRVTLPSPKEWTPARIRSARMLLEALGGLEVRLFLETPAPLLDTTGRKTGPRRCQWLLDSAGWFQDALPILQASWNP